MTTTDDISPFLRHGRHLNGQWFVQVHHTSRGVMATIEGTGETTEAAVDDLYLRLRSLAVWAEEAVESMMINDKPE